MLAFNFSKTAIVAGVSGVAGFVFGCGYQARKCRNDLAELQDKYHGLLREYAQEADTLKKEKIDLEKKITELEKHVDHLKDLYHEENVAKQQAEIALRNSKSENKDIKETTDVQEEQDMPETTSDNYFYDWDIPEEEQRYVIEHLKQYIPKNAIMFGCKEVTKQEFDHAELDDAEFTYDYEVTFKQDDFFENCCIYDYDNGCQYPAPPEDRAKLAMYYLYMTDGTNKKVPDLLYYNPITQSYYRVMFETITDSDRERLIDNALLWIDNNVEWDGDHGGKNLRTSIIRSYERSNK